jgi:CRP-like cAMP-binding protein
VTKQEVGLTLYGVLGILFTILSLYAAVFFWKEIFGGLVRQLWHGGLAGRLLLVGLALFLVGPALRGLVSLLRTMGRGMREVSRKIRFRLETGWRIEAAKLIDALPMFEDLPEEVLSDLAGRVHLRSVQPGKPIIRQGDRPDAFYVVRRGTFHVVEEDPQTQKERVLRVVGSGEAFGELGLVDGRLRTATVRAVEDGQVYEIDKSTFDHLLADMIHVPEFGPTLQAAAELRALPPFATLEASELAELLEHGEWFSAAPGDMIIEQGDVGDSFYVIGSGQVEVSTGEVLLATQGPGEYFGEIALLMDVPRTATVVAKTPARLFRLDREGFDSVVGAALRRGALDPTAAMGRSWAH